MTTLYGYKSVKNNIMVIDYEAIIVKEAYNLYLDGKSDYEIARIFEEQKYLNKSGNVDWSYRRIRDMLTNLKYTGDSIGPKTYSTNIISGKRYENDCFNQYYVENSHTAIISTEVFEKAQEIREKSKINGVRKRKDETALARKIICGKCGNCYRRKIYYNRDKTIRSIEWKCSTSAVNKKGCPDSIAIKESVIIDKAIDEIYRRYGLTIEIDNKNIKDLEVKDMIDRYVDRIEIINETVIVLLLD